MEKIFQKKGSTGYCLFRKAEMEDAIMLLNAGADFISDLKFEQRIKSKSISTKSTLL